MTFLQITPPRQKLEVIVILTIVLLTLHCSLQRATREVTMGEDVRAGLLLLICVSLAGTDTFLVGYLAGKYLDTWQVNTWISGR